MGAWRDRTLVAASAAALAATFVAACLSIYLAAGASAQPAQNLAPACGGVEFLRGTVSRIVDGRTFVIDDGHEVRLAAIEVPDLAPQSAQPGGGAAKAGLEALSGGDEVVLRRAEAELDRYGRTVGYAYIVRDGDILFVQGEMISAGFARVGDRVAGRSCASDLLGREAAARGAKLGLWADPYYDVLDAETPADVLARRGQFALVEGKVASVRESGATIYVNFGRRWSEGFTVTVLKRNERNFAGAGINLPGLAGRRVRVRGFVEARGTTADAARGRRSGRTIDRGGAPGANRDRRPISLRA